MKKIIIISVIAVVVIALILANVLKKEKGTEVDFELVERGTVLQKVTGSGQIRPEIEVNISANVAGKIIRLHAEEGDTVKKSQLLVELDQEQYRASLERAESNLLSMRANEKKLKSELLRAKDLRNQWMTSEAEYEAADASFEAAESNTRQAAAAVNEAKDILDKTRLHSDINGIVTKLNKEEGEIALGAQFQEDVIMTVANLSRMEAAIEVDENEVINVSKGDTADIEIDAFVDTLFKGVVTKIANSATIKGLGTQEQVTNFEVIVTLLDFNERFRPGMSTTVDIITETRNDVLKVPIQAVTVREKKTLEKKEDPEKQAAEEDETTEKEKEMVEVVFCIEENHAVMRPVKMGISDDTHYELKSGVNEGDKVITGPFRILSKSLKDNDLVQFKDKKKEAEASQNDD